MGEKHHGITNFASYNAARNLLLFFTIIDCLSLYDVAVLLLDKTLHSIINAVYSLRIYIYCTPREF